MAAMRHPDEQLVRLARKATPARVRFIEYCGGELERRARELAIGEGLTPAEAEIVARVTIAGAVKAAASACAQAVRDRAFTRMRS
jgi:hypothetical protein